MNTKQALRLLNITDDQFQLSVYKLTRINGIAEYIKDSKDYIKNATEAEKKWVSRATIVQTTDNVERNIAQAEREMVDIAFDGFTTWYKQHNSDIANMAMYKLAMALKDKGFSVSNITYGNDVCASIRVDASCFGKSIHIFVPNSTKFDDDNEEYNQYYVCPKDHNDESIEDQGQYFDIDDLSGIEKYCTALYKLYFAQHDVETLQA